MNTRSPARGAAALPATVHTYADLLRCVRHVLLTNRREIDAWWLRTYHEVGAYINKHLLHHQARAEFGSAMYDRLAADTHVSARSLREYAQFQRYFPIWRSCAKLGWSQARLLCQIDDTAQREKLAIAAQRDDWLVADVERRVRALNAAQADQRSGNGSVAAAGEATLVVTPPARLLVPRRGLPGRYRVVAHENTLRVDVGFKLYLRLSPSQARHRTAGEIVDVDDDGGVAAATDGKPSDLFTYRAGVCRVIDGDTLEVAVVLPHLTMREKLRLRGLDCPERDTAAGRAAHRVVATLVAEAREIIIVTSKVDKYDRYLADVHLRMRSGEEIFLSNHLLAHGHAERMDPASQDGWVP